MLLNKGISSHFQVSHSLALSSLAPGAYHFGATYVGDKQTGPHEVRTIVLFHSISQPTGPLVQISVKGTNPGLKFNPLFWFMYFCMSLYFGKFALKFFVNHGLS